jgi:uncharacterized hydrophobic protein (TIGR00271 family)
MEIHVEIPAADRSKLYDSILQDSHPDMKYVAMLAFAGLIALFGLLQNSTAVIIGAMLISPLMNPILSAALALLLGDGKMGRESSHVLGLSIGGVILITWVIAWLSPLKEVTPEILARTNPNLLDLFIAIFSGLAGTLALRGGSTSMTIIPGVAIAVAVVPPLAVVGYSLSTRQWAMAGGAFLLFMTNLVAIIMSAALVFRLFGFRAHEAAEKGHLKLKYRAAISFLVLVILAVPLIHTLRKGVSQIRTRREISGVLNRVFTTDHSSVADISQTWRDGKLWVRTTIRTTRYFDTSETQRAEDDLRGRFGPDTKLDLDQILVAQGGLSPQQAARLGNVITGGVVRPVPGTEEAPYDLKASQLKLISHLQTQVDDVLAGTPIKRTAPLLVEIGTNQPIIFSLQLASPEPLVKQTVTLLGAQLGSKTSSPVRLQGEAEIQGADYRLAAGLPDARSRLSEKDRQAIGKLVALVRSRPDLQLRVLVASSQPLAQAVQDTTPWRQIRTLIARGRLEASQWSMKASPANEQAGLTTPGGVKPAASPAAATKNESNIPRVALQCQFTVIQTF